MEGALVARTENVRRRDVVDAEETNSGGIEHQTELPPQRWNRSEFEKRHNRPNNDQHWHRNYESNGEGGANSAL